jgi:hypothetical protein
MPVKFAQLGYVKNHGEIPIHFNIVKADMENNLDWYIDKYNPLKITECTIAGELGLRALLPVTEHEALQNTARTQKIILRALESLRCNEVEVFMPPGNVGVDYSGNMHVADGTRLFPFFMCAAVKKWAKSMRRELRKCEIAVINGNLDITKSVVYQISDEVNYLTVLDVSGDRDGLADIADKISDETGLNIVIKSRNKSALRNTDIIINTSATDFDNAYKRGAAVFDLTGNTPRCKQMYTRRPDLFLVDGLLLNYKNAAVSMQMFEMALYLKNRGYRAIVTRGYDHDTAISVDQSLKRMELEIYSFTRLGSIMRNSV